MSIGADCQQCKGKGWHYMNLRNGRNSVLNENIVSCLHPCCKNGKVDAEMSRVYRESWQNYGKPFSPVPA